MCERGSQQRGTFIAELVECDSEVRERSLRDARQQFNAAVGTDSVNVIAESEIDDWRGSMQQRHSHRATPASTDFEPGQVELVRAHAANRG